MDAIVYCEMKIDTWRKAWDIINAVDETKVLRHAPTLPYKAGQIFVAKVADGDPVHWWRSDGRRWENVGTVSCPTAPAICVMKKQCFKLLSWDENVKKLVRLDFERREYFPGSVKMKKGGCIEISEWGSLPYVVIEYGGTGDPLLAVNGPHGNSKASPLKKSMMLSANLRSPHTPGKTPVKFLSPVDCESPVRRPVPSGRDTSKRALFTFKRKVQPPPQETSGISEEIDTEMGTRGTNSFAGTYSLTTITEQENETTTEDGIIDVTDTTKSIDDHFPTSSRAYVRNDPRVLDDMRRAIKSGATPRNAFSAQILKASSRPLERREVDLPRNIRQAYTATDYHVKQDVIYNLYQMEKEITGYFQEGDLFKGIKIVLCLEGLANHVENLYKVYSRLEFVYDTTFPAANFFISTLSFRHPSFKTTRYNTKPSIPLLALLHQFTDEESHKRTFSNIISLVPSFNSEKTVIITDRELSIQNAIKKGAEKVKILLCWKHMKKNFSDWIGKHFKGDPEVDGYLEDIDLFMHAESEEKSKDIVNQFEVKWPLQLVNYFQKHIKSDFLTSSRWVLESLEMYNDVSGVTTNAAESVNSLLKRMIKHKMTDFPRFSMAFYFLSVTKLAEICNGFDGIGEYQLLAEGLANKSRLKLSAKDIEAYLHDIIDVEQIDHLVMEGKFPARKLEQVEIVDPIRELQYHRGNAIRYIKRNKLVFLPDHGLALVFGFQDKPYFVKLGKKYCSCDRKRTCAHIQAVQMANSMDPETFKAVPSEVYNTGRLYDLTRSKRTAKKGPPLLRIPPVQTGHSSKSNEDINQLSASDDDSDSDSSGNLETEMEESIIQNHISDSDTDGLLRAPEVDIMTCAEIRQFSCLPMVTEENLLHRTMVINGVVVTLRDLKSFDITMENDEIKLIEQLDKDFGFDGNSKFVTGNMTDNAIAAYMTYICDDQKHLAVTPSEYRDFLFKSKPLCGINHKGERYCWRLVEFVFVPHVGSQGQWILFVLRCKEKMIQVLDPTSTYHASTEIRHWLTSHFDQKLRGEIHDWTTERLQKPMISQKEIASSGPMILYFAAAIINGKSIDSVNPTEYRIKIFSELVGDCDFKSDLKLCHQCQREKFQDCRIGKETRQSSKALFCVKCKRPTHLLCMKSTQENRAFTCKHNQFSESPM